MITFCLLLSCLPLFILKFIYNLFIYAFIFATVLEWPQLIVKSIYTITPRVQPFIMVSVCDG